MVRPILFNGDMVRAILERRKTVTRRVIKGTDESMYAGLCGLGPGLFDKITGLRTKEPYYRLGDILYVRETWGFNPCTRCVNACNIPAPDKYKGASGCFVYRTDYGITEDDTFPPSMHKWHPSIHMPKEAARIWLKILDIRAERLQDISNAQILAEGANRDRIDSYIRQMEEDTAEWERAAYLLEWSNLWDDTVKEDWQRWENNPWVWVIEFERCGKPEEEEG